MGLLTVLSVQMQLAKSVLGILVSDFSRLGQVDDGFFCILWNTVTQEIELTQPVAGKLAALCSGFFIPADSLFDSFSVLQEPAQRLLGEIIPSLSGSAEPQLCLIIIRQNTQTVPPALTQLVRRCCEAVVPELFQRVDSPLLLRPR